MKQKCENCIYWKEHARKYQNEERKGTCLKILYYQPPYNAGNICKDFELNSKKLNKLNLLGVEYEIEFVEDKLDSTYMGVIKFKKQKIYLEKGWPERTNEESLFHEIIHFVDAKLGLGLTENQVKGLSCSLYSIIKDNKLFS